MYVIAYLVGPELSIVDIIGLVGEVRGYHVVDLFLDSGAEVIEDGLFLLAH